MLLESNRPPAARTNERSPYRVSSTPSKPRFSPRDFIKRLWASRKLLPTTQRWLIFTGVPLLAVWLGLFVLTALEAHRLKTSGLELAVNVALNETDPFTVHTGAAVALAFVSVLLVPVLIGAAVGLVVGEQLRRMRLPKTEVVEDLEHEVKQMRERLMQLEKHQPTDGPDS
jgi:hypothetical protein